MPRYVCDRLLSGVPLSAHLQAAVLAQRDHEEAEGEQAPQGEVQRLPRQRSL